MTVGANAFASSVASGFEGLAVSCRLWESLARDIKIDLLPISSNLWKVPKREESVDSSRASGKDLLGQFGGQLCS